MLLVNQKKLINVVLYYKDSGGTIRVETPETLKELEPEDQKSYTKLIMKMKPLDWKMYNDLQKKALVDRGPGMDDVINWITYKESKFLTIMTEWDAKDDKGNPIPVNPETLSSLHPVIPELALREYDSISILGEPEEVVTPEPNPPDQAETKAEDPKAAKEEVKA